MKRYIVSNKQQASIRSTTDLVSIQNEVNSCNSYESAIEILESYNLKKSELMELGSIENLNVDHGWTRKRMCQYLANMMVGCREKYDALLNMAH